MTESEEELKNLLKRVNEESEKAGLNLNIKKKKKIMASDPITSWQIEGVKVEAVTDFLFLGSKITVGDDCNHKIRRWLLLGRKAMTNVDSVLKSKDIYFVNKAPYSQGYGLSSSHVQVWELDKKKNSWALKNVVLEKTLESPLNCKEIKQVNPQRNQSWIFIGKTDAEAETSILWPPDAKNWLPGKDPDAGKD